MEYLGEISNKFNDYVSYIKEHRNNVSKAWKGMQEKCKHEQIVYDDWIWNHIDECIKRHDLSKFDKEEFTQYRLNFYPCQDEQQNKEEFEIAWKHHYETNDHHWQHWVNEDRSIKKGYSYWGFFVYIIIAHNTDINFWHIFGTLFLQPMATRGNDWQRGIYSERKKLLHHL